MTEITNKEKLSRPRGKCIYCGRLFETTNPFILLGYCNLKCYEGFRRKIKEGYKHPMKEYTDKLIAQRKKEYKEAVKKGYKGTYKKWINERLDKWLENVKQKTGTI